VVIEDAPEEDPLEIPEGPQHLIDLETKSLDPVYVGGAFDFSIRILNRGIGNKYQIKLLHILKDANQTYVTKQESIGLETIISKKSSFLVPSTLKPGRYTVFTNATYANMSTVSYFEISIEPPLEAVSLVFQQNVTRNKTVIVEIFKHEFHPSELNITVGTTVKWVNKDSVSHTAIGAGFNSGPLGRNQEFSHTFNRSSNYPYTCTFHANMLGIIHVREKK